MYDLGEEYAVLNAKYFRGELPVLASRDYVDKNGENRSVYPALKWDGRMKGKTLGVYQVKQRPGCGVIRLSPSIAKDPVLTRSVLLHEMLHKHLDMKSQSDGIKGHGENFTSAAKSINEVCALNKVTYRVYFHDRVITQENPTVIPELLMEEVYCNPDLDITRLMMSVVRAAFDTKYVYNQ